jgi:hypothetical protein
MHGTENLKFMVELVWEDVEVIRRKTFLGRFGRTSWFCLQDGGIVLGGC